MFDEKIRDQVWASATQVDGFDPARFRKDACGAWVLRSHYGQRDSIYGWEIDHIYPQTLGGDDNLENLRVMQWENNLSKGDDYPSYKAAVQSEGNKNVHVENQFTVNKERQQILKQLYLIQ